MINKIFLTIILVIVITFGHAQKNENKWSIGVNPFSIFEPQSTLGPSVSYRFDDKFVLWVELGYILKNSIILPTIRKDLKGFRMITQPRYYINNRKTRFIALDFRFKNYSYTNTSGIDFKDFNTSNVIHISNFKQTQNVFGIAFILGKQYNLFNNFFLESNIGLGVKFRKVNLHNNIPSNYTQLDNIGRHDGDKINYNRNGISVYVPLSIRFFWELNL